MVDQKQKIVEQDMLPRMAEIEQLQELVVGGETFIEDDVIAAIAGVAAREIEGVSSLGTSSIRKTIAERVGGAQPKARGVAVEAGKRETILDIDLKVIYGFSVPDLVVNVRRNVAHRILELCGMVSKEVNIHVVGIEFPDRTPGRVS